MSDTVDTSQPSDRQAFNRQIEGGGPGTALPAIAAVVANCQVQLPPPVAYLLGMADGSTYAQGVALLQMRWANGQAGF